MVDDRAGAAYDDARLALVYDVDNPPGPDHDFFRAQLDVVGATRVIDLGCGTGLLTVTLTGPGRHVTGIDPARAMLDCARRRPGADEVRWVHGTAADIEPGTADAVLMTGNVAMHLVGQVWEEALTRIAAALAPGGWLLFEARNPEAQAWLRWHDELSERDTPAGRLRESLVTDPPDDDGVVCMHCHNEFLDDGGVLDVDQRLQFRTHAEIEGALDRAGLRVLHTYRDWSGRPFHGGSDQPLMIFVAEKG